MSTTSRQDAARLAREVSCTINDREINRKLSLTASECFSAGWDRGIEDARDSYTGALDRIASRTLGDDYAYPESYRNGYLAGYEPAQLD